MSEKYAVIVNDVHKSFKILSRKEDDKGHTKKVKDHKEVLKGISFNVKKGEVFGIVGRNGSGKSTTLKLINRILEPDSGSIEVNGSIASILEMGMGFHPELTGRENIYIKAAMYGFSRKQTDGIIDDVIKYSELGEAIDDPVRTYSTGMNGRLSFAIMTYVKADIMVVDEVLSAGDFTFKNKAKQHFRSVVSSGNTVILVSHSMSTMKEFCDRVLWLDDGVVRELGDPKSVLKHYEKEMTESFELVLSLAESGSATAQNTLGCMYRDGYKIERNDDSAIMWFRESADQGNDAAMVNLANMLYECIGDDGDLEEIKDLYERAADLGNTDARDKLTRLFKEGNSDLDKQLITEYKELADAGHVPSMVRLASLLNSLAITRKDQKESFSYYLKAAEIGDVTAQYQVALMCRDGIGTKKDIEGYRRWLTAASENGSVKSSILLSDLYAEEGSDRSFDYLKRASELGDVKSQYRLATLFKDEKNPNYDLEQSKYWFDQYSGHLSLRGKLMLARTYYKGIEGNPDYIKALFWYERAAEAGDVPAQYQTGVMYRDGIGTKLSYADAEKWFTKASDNGHPGSMLALAKMYESFNKDESLIIDLYKRSASCNNSEAQYEYAKICLRKGDIDGYKRYISLSSNAGFSKAQIELFRSMPKSLEKDRLGNMMLCSKNNDCILTASAYFADIDSISELSKEVLEELKKLSLIEPDKVCRYLGDMYNIGFDNEISQDKAIYWYGKGSESGDPISQYKLSMMFKNGIGVDVDRRKSIDLMKTAADNGHPSAGLVLGTELYKGTIEDQNEAMMWYRKAILCRKQLILMSSKIKENTSEKVQSCSKYSRYMVMYTISVLSSMYGRKTHAFYDQSRSSYWADKLKEIGSARYLDEDTDEEDIIPEDEM